MATGYTYKIKDGISFNDFALTCARAFGALVTLRDEDNDAPIPDEIIPSDYNEKALKKAELKLQIHRALSEDAKIEACKTFNQNALNNYNKSIESARELRSKYNDMLQKVNEWVAPSKDHAGLKEFMQQQISSSIEGDCSTKYLKFPNPVLVEDWYKSEEEELKRSIKYHKEEMKKEIDRAKKRTNWIQLLKKSLATELTVS